MVRKNKGTKIGYRSHLGKGLVNAQRKQRHDLNLTNSAGQKLHITDLENDSTEGLKSVTARNQLDEFLQTAILQEQTFEAEKQNVLIGGPEAVLGLAEEEKHPELYDYEKVPIPRRPDWQGLSAEELDRKERDSFLEWRRYLATMEENSTQKMTPFEKNIEVWRQLWRVVEKSDVVVQIVDGRNPLLFRSQDLEQYVEEINSDKRRLLLVNKADFLSPKMREIWANHFRSQGLDFVFFSALEEAKTLQKSEEGKTLKKERHREEKKVEEEKAWTKQLDKAREMTKKRNEQIAVAKAAAALKAKKQADKQRREEEGEMEGDDEGDADDEEAGPEEKEKEKEKEKEEDVKSNSNSNSKSSNKTGGKTASQKGGKDSQKGGKDSQKGGKDSQKGGKKNGGVDSNKSGGKEKKKKGGNDGDLKKKKEVEEAKELLEGMLRTTKVMSRHDLLALFIAYGKSMNNDGVTIGMVGYPNVGKSSTINILCGSKRVTVSATPGKTKHFQTLSIGGGVTLCDCPGLVFPTFMNSPSGMVVNGILPIDQMRGSDTIPSVALVCKRISREQFLSVYGLRFPDIKPVGPHQLLGYHAKLRGFLKDHGRPNDSKSARIVLKDFLKGKLLYCHPPPNLTLQERTAFANSLVLGKDNWVADSDDEEQAREEQKRKKKTTSSSSSSSSSQKTTKTGGKEEELEDDNDEDEGDYEGEGDEGEEEIDEEVVEEEEKHDESSSNGGGKKNSKEDEVRLKAWVESLAIREEEIAHDINNAKKKSEWMMDEEDVVPVNIGVPGRKGRATSVIGGVDPSLAEVLRVDPTSAQGKLLTKKQHRRALKAENKGGRAGNKSRNLYDGKAAFAIDSHSFPSAPVGRADPAKPSPAPSKAKGGAGAGPGPKPKPAKKAP